MSNLFKRKFNSPKKNADTIDALLTVIVVAVMVVVGGVVLGYFQGAINTTSTGGLPSQARSAINNSFSQIWNVWPLTTVIIAFLGGQYRDHRSRHHSHNNGTPNQISVTTLGIC